MKNSINSNETEMEAKKDAEMQKMQSKVLKIINGEGNEEQKKEALEELFGREFDINSRDNCGNTILHNIVLSRENTNAIPPLVNLCGANVNAKNKKGETPLHIAAMLGDTEVLKILIDLDADVNAKNDRGETHLDLLVMPDNIGVVIEVLTAIDKSNANKAKMQAERQAKMEAKMEAKMQAEKQAEKQNKAVEIINGGGNEEQIKEALEELFGEGKFDINSKDRYGNTILHNIVLSRENTNAILPLVNFGGADINAKNDRGETPLHILASFENGDAKTAETLINVGADVNAKNDRGETPLHIAARHGNPDVIKILTDADKIDVNAKNDRGETPLRLAVVNGNTDAVEILTDAADKIKVNANPGEVPGTSPTNIPDSVEKYTKQQTETERKL